MQRDTRRAILDTAKKLFNEKGYNNVSTGDIAEALGISKGNLTYYFKKKEEIIETIITENPRPQITQAPGGLAELDAFFRHMEETVQENAFYFWHHAQLAQISKTIQSRQQDVFQKNAGLLTAAFEKLAADGIFQKEAYKGEYRRIIDTLLITTTYWVPFCKLKNMPPPNLPEQIWSILYPLLTVQGRKELEEIVRL